jgi:hypothetical protein
VRITKSRAGEEEENEKPKAKRGRGEERWNDAHRSVREAFEREFIPRDPNGIRTRVTAVKGRCPRPLDDRVGSGGNIGIRAIDARQFGGHPVSLSSTVSVNE